MESDFLFKVAVLGDEGVGKSSLIAQYVYNSFSNSTQPTIGAGSANKIMTIGEKTVKFLIWDTAGQEKYRSISKMLYRDAKAVILVFDVTCKRSFESLEKWHCSVMETAPSNVIEVVVGNKLDIGNKKVSDEEIEEFAKKIKAKLYNISAKTGERIDEVFFDIASALVKNTNLASFKDKKNEANTSFMLSENKLKGKAKKKCC